MGSKARVGFQPASDTVQVADPTVPNGDRVPGPEENRQLPGQHIGGLLDIVQDLDNRQTMTILGKFNLRALRWIGGIFDLKWGQVEGPGN